MKPDPSPGLPRPGPAAPETRFDERLRALLRHHAAPESLRAQISAMIRVERRFRTC